MEHIQSCLHRFVYRMSHVNGDDSGYYGIRSSLVQKFVNGPLAVSFMQHTSTWNHCRGQLTDSRTDRFTPVHLTGVRDTEIRLLKSRGKKRDNRVRAYLSHGFTWGAV